MGTRFGSSTSVTAGDGVCVGEEEARVSVTMNRPWGWRIKKRIRLKRSYLEGVEDCNFSVSFWIN